MQLTRNLNLEGTDDTPVFCVAIKFRNHPTPATFPSSPALYTSSQLKCTYDFKLKVNKYKKVNL